MEVFWVVGADEHIERATVEAHRSKEMLARKERSAKTKDETALVSEEKVRLRRHEGELKQLIRSAMLAGAIYFRGNDRSPDDTVDSVTKAASRVLGQVLPDVYSRFAEGAARVTSKDLDSLLSNENLRGLTTVFSQLGLIRDENGQPVFNTDTGPLKEVLDRIENKTSYGEIASGKYLIDDFSKEPFGWNLDVVRLFVVCLVRAGKNSRHEQGHGDRVGAVGRCQDRVHQQQRLQGLLLSEEGDRDRHQRLARVGGGVSRCVRQAAPRASGRRCRHLYPCCCWKI